MARDQLPLGQIQPSARPVSSFVQPGLIQAARPAEPTSVRLSNDSIGLVQTAARPNVQGYDQGEQLARALAPFSENLTNLLKFGAEVYASNEYRQGQNEALKAYSMANRQMLASADQYASENRDLARKDPMAALMMDRANPFRAAGRQNQLSQLASVEMPSIMRREFTKNRAELSQMDPANPRINRVKALAIAQVTQKFGLSELTPGFIDYVAPRMNAEWDKITQQQIDDYNKHLDEMVPRIAGATIFGRIKQMVADGKPLSTIIAIETTYLDSEARKFGIPGKGQEMKAEAIQRALAMAVGEGGLPDAEMRRIIGGILVGPPDDKGVRASAAELYGLEILEATDKYDQIRYRSIKAQREMLGEQYADMVAEATIGLPDGPEKGAALEQVRQREEFKGLPLSERLKIEQQYTNVTEDITSRSYADDAGSSFLQGADSLYGKDWNPQLLDQEYQAQRAQVAPERRAQFDADYAALRRRKEEQKKSMPEGLISGAIARAVKANLEAKYPDMVTAAMRGAANIEQIMALGDANSSRSVALQNGAFRQAIYAAIDAKRGQVDRDLTPAEFQQIIDATLAGYEKNAPQTWKTLFPGVGEQPGVVPLRQNRPDPGSPQSAKPPEGRRFQESPTFSVSQLDTIPNRAQRLANWRGEAVLSAEATARLIAPALNGDPLPAALRRAAKDAGTSPQQFLLQQVDFYPGIKLSPAARAQLGRSGQQSRSAERYGQSVAAGQSRGNSWLSAAGDWALNAITGTTPAYAGERFLDRMPSGASSRSSIATLRTMGRNDFGGLARLVGSGEGGFNSYNTGTTASAGTMNLTGMTIGQVRQLQRQGRVSAVGFAQWMPHGQLDKAMKAAGLSPSDKFSPDNQLKMFWAYVLKSSKQPALRDYLTGVSNDLNAAHIAIANEWAGLQGPSGRGHYDGDSAGNRASVRAAAVRQALIRARQQLLGGRN